jgi:hypothetical protein
MEEQEKQLEEFDLEEILREFSDHPQEPDEQPQKDEEEDVLVWDGVMPETNRNSTPLPQDTVRLDEINKAVQKQEKTELEQTVTFTPVYEQEEEEEFIMPQEPAEPAVEPYSEEWEPEYEQPMGEYIPPQPIVFRPKSRLRELKRKLVAGPEKRYYELSELGFGKLQAAIFANLLVAVLSAGTTALYTAGMIGPERTRFVVFVQFLSLLLSALLGSYQLMEGFSDIFKRRFSLNSLLIFSLAACLMDGILCLQQVRVPCCAAFSLNMTMSLWSTYQKRSTEIKQMDTMRKAVQLDKIVGVEDYYEGRPGFVKAEGQVEDFMETYAETSGPEKVLSVYALIAMLVSLALGVAVGVLYGITLGVQTFSSTLLVAVPATAFITLSRPKALLERRLHKLGTVICGWQGVRNLSAQGVFPVEDTDLFPAGATKMNGVKFYGQRQPDEVVAYAAALIIACGGGMEPLFIQLLESRNAHHYTAEKLRSYPGGVGAVINDEAVLAGSLSFMQDMGVEMPDGNRVSQAIYVAIDGSLSGVFAISYARTKASATGLTTLCAYRGLTPVMLCGDFMLTEGFLRSKFGVNTRRMVFADRATRDDLLAIQPEEDSVALAMTTRDGLASTAYAVTGARALRSASRLGVVIHMLGGILGIVIMAILGLMGVQHLLTPTNILLYELIWMLPGLLITEWTRSV